MHWLTAPKSASSIRCDYHIVHRLPTDADLLTDTDIFMSLIHTAELAGVDVFDYLVAVQRHASDAAERPGQWLPWNYRQSLASLSPDPPA